MSATLTTLDAIFKDFYLPAAASKLDDYPHECGTNYLIKAQDADGRIFRWVQDKDAWDATVYLLCPNPSCEDSPTSYVQGRLRINGESIAKLREYKTTTFLDALKNELDDLFEDFQAEISAATR